MLLIVCGVLVAERVRLTKELAKVYQQRDKYRTGFVLCKSACDQANIKPDLSFMNELLSGEA